MGVTSNISSRINYMIPRKGHVSFVVSMIMLKLPRA